MKKQTLFRVGVRFFFSISKIKDKQQKKNYIYTHHTLKQGIS